MNIEMFIGLLIMLVNDVARRNFLLSFGYRPEQGVALLSLIILLFVTAYACVASAAGNP